MDVGVVGPSHYRVAPPPEIFSIAFAVSVNTAIRFIFVSTGNVAATLMSTLTPMIRWDSLRTQFPWVEDSFI